MAAIITRIGNFFDKTGATERRIGRYTGQTSYTTGGESLPPEQLAMSSIDFLVTDAMTNGTVVLIARYDHTNKKMKVFDMAGAEVANATDLSGYTARFEAIGR